MSLMRLSPLVLSATLALGGCATVTTGTRQSFEVLVQGAGAVHCTLQKVGYGPVTVSAGEPVQIPRGEEPLSARCAHPGFESASLVVESHVQDRAKYELPMGMLIDYLSGARYEYPAQVTLTLNPVFAALGFEQTGDERFVKNFDFQIRYARGFRQH
jgi:hypothetical protein